ncbi:putative fad binding domain protein [Phaeomoniella chlamydospora]|uniref:Putative fad binding domain protein n=1 Tax=Phaeomoniella chlamydospora TaxID=158046 RepID=A0A0G2EGK4_PHACM|nr:putative fad binding domain protein [Phaeomoniella chlamydospora]
MNLTGLVNEYFLPTCEVKIPDPNAEVHQVISRWSDLNVSLPAIVVVPATESDIVASIRFATDHKLKVIPTGGGHGSFVPINSNTLYLDLNKFTSISLNEESKSVQFGGGVTAGQLVKACAERGYYTLYPNANGVGMVGAILGGGNNPFNGMHGIASDHLISIRLVTGIGNIVIISRESDSNEARLFNAFCGGGHGLGVVTAAEIRIFPIKDLGMDNERIWMRKLVFPPPAIDFAARLFVSLLHPSSKMLPMLVFARAPPNSPVPGAPVIMLTVQYYGRAATAENEAAILFDPEVDVKAIMSETTQIPVTSINDIAERLGFHGGYKEFYHCFLKDVTATALKRAYQRWIKFGVECEDALPASSVVLAVWNTDAMLENDSNGNGFFRWRDRGIFFQTTAWFDRYASKAKAESFGRDMLRLIIADGSKPAAFTNHMRYRIDLKEIYTEEMVQELARIKMHWDPQSIFWSPVVDGV